MPSCSLIKPAPGLSSTATPNPIMTSATVFTTKLPPSTSKRGKIKLADEVRFLATEIRKGEYLQKLAARLDSDLAISLHDILECLGAQRDINLEWVGFRKEDKITETGEQFKTLIVLMKDTTKPIIEDS